MKYETVDEKWEELKKRILNAIQNHVPKRSSKLITSKKQNFPLPNQLLSKIRKKNRCWQRYMETRDDSKYRDYVKLRNQVRNECRKAHISHEQRIADTAKEKPKHFWDYVRSKSKVRSGISNLEMEPKTGKRSKNDSK